MIPLNRQILTDDGFFELRPPTGSTVKLAAFGDLAFHGPILNTLILDSPHEIFDGIRDCTTKADLVIGNLESVLVKHPYSPLGSKACLISDMRALRGLGNAGFHVLTLANNHILDAGQAGLEECLEGIAASGMQATGAGKDVARARIPAVIRVGSFTFKVFAYCYGAGQIAGRGRAGCNEALLEVIQRDLSEFCDEGDFPVVCLHMDAEFQSTPAPDRVSLCRDLAKSGVPLILCHHPHVVQGIEVHEGSLIAYSLGNFVFPILPYMKNNSDECHLTFHLEIDVDKDGPVAARIEPAVIDTRGHPIRAAGPERRELLSMIAERSRLIGDPAELERRYFQMVKQFTHTTFKNMYWAVGERDFGRFKLLLKSLVVSRTKRNWVRHYLQKRLFGV